MQNLYFCTFNELNSIFYTNTFSDEMNLGIYIVLAIFALLMFFFAMIVKIAPENEIYSDIDIEEWSCPNCGFQVQVGNLCIYCDTYKE